MIADRKQNWYSHYSGMPKPIPFSSTWNVQSKVALKTIKQIQKGIRFHNGFLHWRQAGDEVRFNLVVPAHFTRRLQA
jgi:hypothetical protein